MICMQSQRSSPPPPNWVPPTHRSGNSRPLALCLGACTACFTLVQVAGNSPSSTGVLGTARFREVCDFLLDFGRSTVSATSDQHPWFHSLSFSTHTHPAACCSPETGRHDRAHSVLSPAAMSTVHQVIGKLSSTNSCLHLVLLPFCSGDLYRL